MHIFTGDVNNCGLHYSISCLKHSLQKGSNLQNQYTKTLKKGQFTHSKSPRIDLAVLHCSMFKLTHPSSLPGRKSHAQLGIVLKGACHLASLHLAHTHMRTVLGQSGITPNNRRLGLVFPWQSAPAIFPRWQQNPVPSAARNHV